MMDPQDEAASNTVEVEEALLEALNEAEANAIAEIALRKQAGGRSNPKGRSPGSNTRNNRNNQAATSSASPQVVAVTRVVSQSVTAAGATLRAATGVATVAGATLQAATGVATVAGATLQAAAGVATVAGATLQAATGPVSVETDEGFDDAFLEDFDRVMEEVATQKSLGTQDIVRVTRQSSRAASPSPTPSKKRKVTSTPTPSPNPSHPAPTPGPNSDIPAPPRTSSRSRSKATPTHAPNKIGTPSATNPTTTPDPTPVSNHTPAPTPTPASNPASTANPTSTPGLTIAPKAAVAPIPTPEPNPTAAPAVVPAPSPIRRSTRNAARSGNADTPLTNSTVVAPAPLGQAAAGTPTTDAAPIARPHSAPRNAAPTPGSNSAHTPAPTPTPPASVPAQDLNQTQPNPSRSGSARRGRTPKRQGTPVTATATAPGNTDTDADTAPLAALAAGAIATPAATRLGVGSATPLGQGVPPDSLDFMLPMPPKAGSRTRGSKLGVKTDSVRLTKGRKPRRFVGELLAPVEQLLPEAGPSHCERTADVEMAAENDQAGTSAGASADVNLDTAAGTRTGTHADMSPGTTAGVNASTGAGAGTHQAHRTAQSTELSKEPSTGKGAQSSGANGVWKAAFSAASFLPSLFTGRVAGTPGSSAGKVRKQLWGSSNKEPAAETDSQGGTDAEAGKMDVGDPHTAIISVLSEDAMAVDECGSKSAAPAFQGRTSSRKRSSKKGTAVATTPASNPTAATDPNPDPIPVPPTHPTVVSHPTQAQDPSPAPELNSAKNPTQAHDPTPATASTPVSNLTPTANPSPGPTITQVQETSKHAACKTAPPALKRSGNKHGDTGAGGKRPGVDTPGAPSAARDTDEDVGPGSAPEAGGKKSRRLRRAAAKARKSLKPEGAADAVGAADDGVVVVDEMMTQDDDVVEVLTQDDDVVEVIPQGDDAVTTQNNHGVEGNAQDDVVEAVMQGDDVLEVAASDDDVVEVAAPDSDIHDVVAPDVVGAAVGTAPVNVTSASGMLSGKDAAVAVDGNGMSHDDGSDDDDGADNDSDDGSDGDDGADIHEVAAVNANNVSADTVGVGNDGAHSDSVDEDGDAAGSDSGDNDADEDEVDAADEDGAEAVVEDGAETSSGNGEADVAPGTRGDSSSEYAGVGEKLGVIQKPYHAVFHNELFGLDETEEEEDGATPPDTETTTAGPHSRSAVDGKDETDNVGRSSRAQKVGLGAGPSGSHIIDDEEEEEDLLGKLAQGIRQALHGQNGKGVGAKGSIAGSAAQLEQDGKKKRKRRRHGKGGGEVDQRAVASTSGVIAGEAKGAGTSHQAMVHGVVDSEEEDDDDLDVERLRPWEPKVGMAEGALVSSKGKGKQQAVEKEKGLAKQLLAPPRDEVLASREASKKAPDTAGPQWYGLPATAITNEMKQELRLLHLRGAYDPKHFYKRMDSTKLPKYFQVGTVLDTPTDFYGGRLTNAERKSTLADELLADPAITRYRKKRARAQNEAQPKQKKRKTDLPRLKKSKKHSTH